jgi:hypothetical protein
VTNLFEDIKALYKIAGFKGQPVCFIFTDAEVKDEGFLEYINQILMTGGWPPVIHEWPGALLADCYIPCPCLKFLYTCWSPCLHDYFV